MESVNPPAPFSLNYKILGRRRLEGDMFDLEHVDVEWTHVNGAVMDYITVPTSHPPNIKYETREAGPRTVIKDQVSVKPNTPDSIVMQILEERRERLAKNLGVKP